MPEQAVIELAARPLHGLIAAQWRLYLWLLQGRSDEVRRGVNDVLDSLNGREPTFEIALLLLMKMDDQHQTR
jgi:hypothetical protein